MQEEPSEGAPIDVRALYAKITWRIIPFIFFLYILAYLDRVNVGFAALQMKHDLRLSDTVYGTGAGIFFLGQGMFELPSNLLLGRYGPRVWISRIMITWGIVATLMALVEGPRSFYLLRFLLGLTEAGFVPGMILYLSFWFPSGERARAIAKFMTATSLAGVVGAPISGALLRLEGYGGLHGWQWLFLVEGVPSVLVGISVLWIMKNGPHEASWLSPGERQWLTAELERDRRAGGAHERHRLLDAFRLPVVWVLAGILFLDQLGVYTVNLWMPLVLGSVSAARGMVGVSASRVATYSTLPYLAAAVFTVLIGTSSDRRRERRWHMVLCMSLSAIGFFWAAVAGSLPLALGAFTFAAVGYWSLMGPFWALPTRLLGGRAAAGGVAVITMVGSAGAFVGPYLTGRMRDATGGFAAGLNVVGATAVLAAILCLFMPSRRALTD